MSEKKAVAKTTDKKAVAKKTEGKKKFNIVKTFKDMWAEIKKVTWPSKKELVRQSTVVIVFVLLLTVIVGLMDWGLPALRKPSDDESALRRPLCRRRVLASGS